MSSCEAQQVNASRLVLRLKDCLMNVLGGVGDVLEIRTSVRTVRRFVAGRMALSVLLGVVLKEVAMHDTVLVWRVRW